MTNKRPSLSSTTSSSEESAIQTEPQTSEEESDMQSGPRSTETSSGSQLSTPSTPANRDLSRIFGIAITGLLGSAAGKPEPAPESWTSTEVEPFALVRAKPDKAPGCFGRVRLYDEHAPECQECPFAGACNETTSLNRARLVAWESKHVAGRSDVHLVYRRNLRFIVQSDPCVAAAPCLQPIDPTLRDAILGLIRRCHLDALKHRLNRERRKARNDVRLKRSYPDPKIRIAHEAKARLSFLTRHTRMGERHKRLDQLRGREAEIVEWWSAIQLARLEHGDDVTDAAVADQFNKRAWATSSASRHQARTKRLLIQRMERAGSIWSRFAAAEIGISPRDPVTRGLRGPVGQKE